MPSDSLAYTNYMLLARFITTCVQPRIGGRNGLSAPTLGKYTPKDEIMLLEHLRKEREAL